VAKPIVLSGGPLDRRIRVELAVETDAHFQREVETTRRGLLPHVVGRHIRGVVVRNAKKKARAAKNDVKKDVKETTDKK